MKILRGKNPNENFEKRESKWKFWEERIQMKSIKDNTTGNVRKTLKECLGPFLIYSIQFIHLFFYDETKLGTRLRVLP